jgi:phosphoribosylformylglycinamidine cyclo-ligase
MAEACREAGCALLGGETAEMPGMYHEGEYDVAGFIVGSVARDRMVLGKDIVPGDAVLALPSNGLHTNGYSLARKVFGVEGSHELMRERLSRHIPELGRSLGEALAETHRAYLREISPLLDLPERPIKGMAHITGGGLVDNIPRILPDGCAVALDTGAWEVPWIFRLIQSEGDIDPAEMARVFNMGLGMVMVAAPEHVELIEARIPEAMLVGEVVKAEDGEHAERVIFTRRGTGTEA